MTPPPFQTLPRTRPAVGYTAGGPVPVARLRLLCFHHAGGAASAFHGWQDVLGADVAVLPVQLPGREQRVREPRHRDAEALLADLDENLAPLLEGEHVFYGHSMGAHLAHALVRRRVAAGLPAPRALIVGGARAPHLPQPLVEARTASDDDLARLLVRLGGVSTELLRYPDWLRAATSLLRDDLAVCSGFPDPAAEPLPVPIHVFTGAADPLVRADQAAAWDRHTREECRVHVMPGGHFFPAESRSAFLTRVSSILSRL
ncbi:thioesterase II family protein [Nocardiopsis deserti]|uniref:thioesterase II family protein n=1 Tax=Nocardiopsis deserti TaxID=2605988 RepID=UPI001239EA99|nr:alpha/beta fold hydrolase [Nocardiopsis deserti]